MGVVLGVRAFTANEGRRALVKVKLSALSGRRGELCHVLGLERGPFYLRSVLFSDEDGDRSP